ncbi:MAG: hypothetical protein RMM06_01490 [Armatimonadota bacterium]|nr:hypothetical protein [Armatimonadota bacterium]
MCTTNVLARSAGFILQRLHEKATGARARDVEAHISAPHYGEEDDEDG